MLLSAFTKFFFCLFIRVVLSVSPSILLSYSLNCSPRVMQIRIKTAEHLLFFLHNYDNPRSISRFPSAPSPLIYPERFQFIADISVVMVNSLCLS